MRQDTGFDWHTRTSRFRVQGSLAFRIAGSGLRGSLRALMIFMPPHLARTKPALQIAGICSGKILVVAVLRLVGFKGQGLSVLSVASSADSVGKRKIVSRIVSGLTAPALNMHSFSLLATLLRLREHTCNM